MSSCIQLYLLAVSRYISPHPTASKTGADMAKNTLQGRVPYPCAAPLPVARPAPSLPTTPHSLFIVRPYNSCTRQDTRNTAGYTKAQQKSSLNHNNYSTHNEEQAFHSPMTCDRDRAHERAPPPAPALYGPAKRAPETTLALANKRDRKQHNV